MPKQQSPEAKEILAKSIALEMLSMAMDEPDKTLNLRYKSNGLICIYNRFVDLVGERRKWGVLEENGLVLIEGGKFNKPQAVMVAPKEPIQSGEMRWQE